MGMQKISYINIEDLKIEGIEGDYVFETIREKNNFYENELLNKWKRYLSDSKVVFDVGANLGNHTLFWAKKLNTDVIYSFEPYIPNFERLLHNVQNNLLDNVYPINKAIGKKEGYTCVKEFHEDNYGGTTLNEEIQSEGEIEVITIDSFVKGKKIESVDFIKIDTEGYEVSVLDGAQKTISKYYPDLWIEVNSQTFQEIMNRLEQLEYIVADTLGFNILFLNPRRHTKIEQIDINIVWKAMFNNLERVNIYYKNYLTAKGWNEAKEKKLQLASEREKALNEALDSNKQKLQLAATKEKALNEKLASNIQKLQLANTKVSMLDKELTKSNQNLQLADIREKALTEKLINSNQKYKELIENYNKLEEKEKKYELEIVKCLKDYDLMSVRTEQMLRRIAKLEAQNSMLILENSEQKRQLDIIKNSRIGRMGIKAYQVYKKLRGR